MKRAKREVDSSKNVGRSGNSAESRDATGASHTAEVLQRAVQSIEAGHFDKAFNQLASLGSVSHEVVNARGVCLMRMGKARQAVDLFRSLVLQSGCMWMRPEVPVVCKINFATALLLDGHPRGGVAILAEVNEPQNPDVQQLKAAIRRWVKGLSWWNKLNWWTGVDLHEVVPLDFSPGKFLSVPQPESAPTPVRPPNFPKAA